MFFSLSYLPTIIVPISKLYNKIILGGVILFGSICKSILTLCSLGHEFFNPKKISNFFSSSSSSLFSCFSNRIVSRKTKVMDQKTKPFSLDEQQQQKKQNQEPLRCPRCDSINTKFCYYNNYSLSQPRHFCKACKRYWTRGGSLRNVPIGGGFKKNKRVRRSSSTNSCIINSSQLDHVNNNSSVSSHGKNPMFYGYAIQNPPQINDFGCGLATKQTFQDLIFSNPLLSSYTTISSLLSSSNLQSKGSNSLQTLLPSYDQDDDDLQMKVNGQATNDWMFIKEMDQQTSTQDPSLLWGSWLDPSNNHIDSSVFTLI